jgi:hypothetical protein
LSVSQERYYPYKTSHSYNIQIFDEVIGTPGSAEANYQSVQNVPLLDKKGELKVCMSMASTASLLYPLLEATTFP